MSNSVDLSKDLGVSEFKEYVSNPFYNLDEMETFYFTYDENMTQVALGKIYSALYSYCHSAGKDSAKYAYDMAREALSSAQEKCDEANAILDGMRALLDEVSAVASKRSQAESNFKIIMTELIGKGDAATIEESFAAAEVGGCLGDLKEYLKTKWRDDVINYLINDIDTVIGAIKGTQNPISKGWTGYVTIDTFYDKFTPSVYDAIKRLYDLFCRGEVNYGYLNSDDKSKLEQLVPSLRSDSFSVECVKKMESLIYSGDTGGNVTRPSGGNNDQDSGAGLMALANLKKNIIPKEVNALRQKPGSTDDLFKKWLEINYEVATSTQVDSVLDKLNSVVLSQQTLVDGAVNEVLTKTNVYNMANEVYQCYINSNVQEILDLALRYNTFDGGQSVLDNGGQIQKITSIKYQNGTYVAVTEPVNYKTQVNAQDAMKNLSIPYYSLTVCLEKANVVRDVMVAQVQILQDINDAIEKNNEYLRNANKCYEQYYEKCIENSKQKSYSYNEGFGSGLDLYVTNECGYKFSSRNIKYGVYNKEGTDDNSKGFTNIDVEEQGNLTKISNAQEAIRMKGDELNTSSQMATTKLQQYTQNYNSSISIASQLAKSVGENFKNIASNVR